MAFRRRGPVPQGDDHILVSFLIPAQHRETVDSVVEAMPGSCISATNYACIEDFEEAETAIYHGSAIATALHKALRFKNGGQ